MDHSRIGPPQGYLPIEEHGIVGDLRTVALVGTDGTVDWYCPSRFDAPSLFGALLDARKGGYFSLLQPHRLRQAEAALPARHQHPADPVPRQGGGRRGHRLHGARDEIDRAGPATCWSGRPRGPRPGHLRAGLPPGVRLRPVRPRGPDRPGGRRRLHLRRSAGRCCAPTSPLKAEENGVAAYVHPRRGRERQLPPGVERRGPADRRRRDRGAVHHGPRSSGRAGSPSRATAAAGARWCSGPRSR